MSTEEQDWQVESLRCTVFIDVNTEFDCDSWWADVVGGDPEEIQQKPSSRSYVAKGQWHGGSLSLIAQPGRIDWKLGAAPPDAESIVTIPIAGEFPVVDEFSKLVDEWLRVAPVAARIAFGAVWLKRVSGHEEGYTEIDALLPNVTIDSETSQDFMYQINHRRASSVVGSVIVNRLSKWAILVLTPVHIQIQSSGPVVSTEQQGATIAMRLEVDINTVPESIQEIDGDNAVNLFDELVQLGKEIAVNGATV